MRKSRAVDRTKVYTTGEVAQICNTSTRTVMQWIDAGKLRGYRLPSGRGGHSKAGDRRVTRSALLRFLRENGMPVAAVLGNGICRVVTVGLQSSLPPVAGCEIVAAATAFEAGMACAEQVPDVVVVELSGNRHAGLELARALRRAHPGAKLFGLVTEDEADLPELFAAGFNVTLSPPGQLFQLETYLAVVAEELAGNE